MNDLIYFPKEIVVIYNYSYINYNYINYINYNFLSSGRKKRRKKGKY